MPCVSPNSLIKEELFLYSDYVLLDSVVISLFCSIICVENIYTFHGILTLYGSSSGWVAIPDRS